MNDRRPIFDVNDRASTSPQRHGEPVASFMNRVAGPFWDDVRELIQSWADRVELDNDYRDIASRLRNRNDQQYEAAMLELIVHEALLRGGYEVEIHPDVPGGSKKPDFRATGPTGHFYVEVIAPAGISGAALAEKKRIDRFLATLNDLGDHNFLLRIERLKTGPGDARGSAGRSEIAKWLKTLDPDEPRQLGAEPKYRWTDQGWDLIVAALPIRAEHRGPQDRSIGVYAHYPAWSANDAPTVTRALAAKQSKYGDLGAPFVIVCGVDFRDTRDRQVIDALFGRTKLSYVQDSEDDYEERRVGGFFGAPGAWRAKRVSAVIIANHLKLHQMHTARIDIWEHPGAERPLPPGDVLPGARRTWDGERLLEGARPSANEFFALPNPWPAHDPWTN